MHKLCVSALQECEPPHTMGYTSFRKIWKRYVPDVRVMTPRTDVCRTVTVCVVKSHGRRQEGVDVPVTLPPVLSPPGMSQARRDYLQKMVAPYFSGEAQVALPWS